MCDIKSFFNYLFIFNPRCLISECEDISNTNYNTSWLEYAVPFEKDIPSSCNRYKFLDSSVCSQNSFDPSDEYQCNEFVYKTNDKTLVNEVIKNHKKNKY